MAKTTKSPTQRTMAKLRIEGCELVQIVEHWNGWGKCRQDLFGFVDVLAIVNGVTVGIQVTTSSNMSARFSKIAGEHSDVTQALLNAGWRIEIHGWRKKALTGKWECRIKDVFLRGSLLFGQDRIAPPL